MRLPLAGTRTRQRPAPQPKEVNSLQSPMYIKALEREHNTVAHKKGVKVEQVAIRGGEDALIRYITSPSGKSVFSLGFLHKSQRFVLSLRFVEQGVAKAAMIIQAEDKREKRVLEVPDEVTYKSKKSFGNKTLLSKMKSIEGSGNG